MRWRWPGLAGAIGLVLFLVGLLLARLMYQGHCSATKRVSGRGYTGYVTVCQTRPIPTLGGLSLALLGLLLVGVAVVLAVIAIVSSTRRRSSGPGRPST